METVEHKIRKVRKILHVLRYAVTTSFYKNNDLQLDLKNAIKVDLHTRVHPATKRLLYSNSESAYDRRQKKQNISTKCQTVTPKEENDYLNIENISLTDNKCYNPVYSCLIDSVRNRRLSKIKIIVGNISKWTPSNCREDNTTHKWMVYVRTPKDSVDILNFVEAVNFYLHPSYKPNDVIKLR